MQVMTEKTMTSSVTEMFPCSSGTEHHTKEMQVTKMIDTPTQPPVSDFHLEVFHSIKISQLHYAGFIPGLY